MARNIRSSELENRTNRLKLPVTTKPTYVRIGPGLSLGYRKNQAGGKWVMRTANGKGGMVTNTIAEADDHSESNGQTILDFFQAQAMARKLFNEPNVVKHLTIQECVDNYLIVLKSKNSNTAYDTKLRLQKHFIPQFGEKTVSSLTKTQLDQWQASLVSKSTDIEVIRQSKDLANRVLGMVRAVLNHAMKDQSYNLNDAAWRFVKPFRNVGQPRSIRYTEDEVQKLITNAPNKSTSNLIEGAYLTGLRLGEMTSAKVSSFNSIDGKLKVTGKTGTRIIFLQQDAIEFFRGLTNSRTLDEYIFTKENGSPWKPSDQKLPFKTALKNANLPSDGSIYALRHTYASMAIENGMPLMALHKHLGTSVKMLQNTYSHILAENERAFIEAGAPKSLRK